MFWHIDGYQGKTGSTISEFAELNVQADKQATVGLSSIKTKSQRLSPSDR
jgi:hypothetical protein